MKENKEQLLRDLENYLDTCGTKPEQVIELYKDLHLYKVKLIASHQQFIEILKVLTGE